MKLTAALRLLAPMIRSRFQWPSSLRSAVLPGDFGVRCASKQMEDFSAAEVEAVLLTPSG